MAWRSIEVVITGLTRNQFVSFGTRGFESHLLRLREIANPLISTDWLFFNDLCKVLVFSIFTMAPADPCSFQYVIQKGFERSLF